MFVGIKNTKCLIWIHAVQMKNECKMAGPNTGYSADERRPQGDLPK